jgi:hypothetical protein
VVFRPTLTSGLAFPDDRTTLSVTSLYEYCTGRANVLIILSRLALTPVNIRRKNLFVCVGTSRTFRATMACNAKIVRILDGFPKIAQKIYATYCKKSG